ncbi:single-stranded DNA-binding protein [Viridibacillus arvi]|uniref:single-stranded DNA-binding protein n=1 Tax=Viridibacillus arvi TaxID=263475 RepID=UPI003D034765
MNNVNLIGRLTKDAELRYTPQGKASGSFTLAVQRDFKNANGEYDVDFILCQVWDKRAEALANNTKKGSQLGVTGRIQSRNYEGSDGKRVYITEVIVSNIKYLDSKQQQGNGRPVANSEQQGNYNNSPQQNRQQNPGGNSSYQRGGENSVYEDPFAQHQHISNDDLPF